GADGRVVCAAVAAGEPIVSFGAPFAFELREQAQCLVVLVGDMGEGRLAVPVLLAVEAVHRAVTEQHLPHEGRHGTMPCDEVPVVEQAHRLLSAYEKRRAAEKTHGRGAGVLANTSPDAGSEVVSVDQQQWGVVSEPVEHPDSVPDADDGGNGADGAGGAVLHEPPCRAHCCADGISTGAGWR